ncbi:MAG: MATE family efflux transporter [Lachnospiraceae bacterium]|nr:MATE family efflux transporter [Lachnospiraceae bacterium]
MKNDSVLEKGSFWELMVKLSIPTIVVILIMIVYNVADTYFIGQTGDPNKISAISLGMPLFTILSGIGTLFGTGGTTSVSIALGEGNKDKIRNVTGFCLAGGLCIGLIFFAIVFVFSDTIAILLGADSQTLTDTITYIKIFSFSAPLVLLSQCFGSIIRADGDGATPMMATLSGTFLNIILDALFILVFHWDVFGAAFATVLGNVLTSVILVALILTKKRAFLPSINRQAFTTGIMIPVITLGLPMTVSTILSSVSGIIANRMMMSYGSTYLAAQSVAGKVNMVITMLIMAICMGMQPAISYNFGAKNYTRMKYIIKSTGVFTIGVGLVLTILVFIFKNRLVAAFINDADVIAIGQIFVLAGVVIGPVFGIYQLCQSSLQATGKASYAIFTSLLDKGIIYLPMLVILNKFFGAYGVAFTHAATMFFTIIVTVLLTLKWFRSLTLDTASSHPGSIESEDVDVQQNINLKAQESESTCA